MSYQILFKRSAAKALKKIPKAEQKRIANKIDSLAESLQPCVSAKNIVSAPS